MSWRTSTPWTSTQTDASRGTSLTLTPPPPLLQDLMYVMAHIHALDLNSDGRITWHELLTGLQAVVPKSSRTGKVRTGFGKKSGYQSSYNTTSR